MCVGLSSKPFHLNILSTLEVEDLDLDLHASVSISPTIRSRSRHIRSRSRHINIASISIAEETRRQSGGNRAVLGWAWEYNLSQAAADPSRGRKEAEPISASCCRGSIVPYFSDWKRVISIFCIWCSTGIFAFNSSEGKRSYLARVEGTY